MTATTPYFSTYQELFQHARTEGALGRSLDIKKRRPHRANQ